MGLKECLEKGLLRKSETAKGKVDNSLLIASDFLEQAKGNLKMQYFNVIPGRNPRVLTRGMNSRQKIVHRKVRWHSIHISVNFYPFLCN